MLRAIGRNLLSHRGIAKVSVCRTLSHYPIDESIFGLTEDQIQVKISIPRILSRDSHNFRLRQQ